MKIEENGGVLLRDPVFPPGMCELGAPAGLCLTMEGKQTALVVLLLASAPPPPPSGAQPVLSYLDQASRGLRETAVCSLHASALRSRT